MAHRHHVLVGAQLRNSNCVGGARHHDSDYPAHNEEHQGNAGNATSPTGDEKAAEPVQG